MKQKPHEKFLEICERISMLRYSVEAFRENLPKANQELLMQKNSGVT